jgi:hypothetical protein
LLVALTVTALANELSGAVLQRDSGAGTRF